MTTTDYKSFYSQGDKTGAQSRCEDKATWVIKSAHHLSLQIAILFVPWYLVHTDFILFISFLGLLPVSLSLHCNVQDLEVVSDYSLQNL